MSRYKELGFASRREYLDDLADEWGASRFLVHELAAMLGPSEDFDGLVIACEDDLQGTAEGAEW